MKSDEELADELHRAYETYSKTAGWKTQKKCRVKFSELPEENQVVMISLARLIRVWIREALDQQLKEIKQKKKISITRYDDSYGYDLEEDYYRL